MQRKAVRSKAMAKDPVLGRERPLGCVDGRGRGDGYR